MAIPVPTQATGVVDIDGVDDTEPGDVQEDAVALSFLWAWTTRLAVFCTLQSVTWPFDSRRPFPIGGPLELSLYF